MDFDIYDRNVVRGKFGEDAFREAIDDDTACEAEVMRHYLSVYLRKGAENSGELDRVLADIYEAMNTSMRNEVTGFFRYCHPERAREIYNSREAVK